MLPALETAMLAPAVVRLTPVNAPVTAIDDDWLISVNSVSAELLSLVKMLRPLAVLDETTAPDNWTNCAVIGLSDCGPKDPVNVVGYDVGNMSQRLPESWLKPEGGA